MIETAGGYAILGSTLYLLGTGLYLWTEELERRDRQRWANHFYRQAHCWAVIYGYFYAETKAAQADYLDAQREADRAALRRWFCLLWPVLTVRDLFRDLGESHTFRTVVQSLRARGNH